MDAIQYQTFRRATVVLDGKFFVRCQFLECTVIYCGGDFGWRDAQFQNCQIQLDGTADRVVKFLQFFGLIPGGAVQQPPNPALNTGPIN